MLKKLRFISLSLYGKINKPVYFLLFLMMLGMVFEFIGLGVIFPLILSLIDPNELYKYELVEKIYELFNLTSKSQLTYLFLITIFLIYAVKTIFMVYFIHKQNTIVAKIISKISHNLYSIYLNQPFTFHIKNNSSRLIKNIQIEVNYLSSYLMSGLEIIINLGMIFSLVVILILIEPIGAVSVAGYFIFTAFLYYQIIKPYIKKWGEKRGIIVESMSKTLIEGLQSVRELILFNAINTYSKKFQELNNQYANVTAKNNTSQQLPRLFFELSAIIGIILFISVLIFDDQQTSNILSTIGVFTAAVFRMIPSVNRAVFSLQNIKFYTPSVELIYGELKKLKVVFNKKSSKKFQFNKDIKFENVFFKYKSESDWILENINLNIKKGDYIGIKGQSGVGKSTLIDLLAGIFKPIEGKVIVDKNDISIDESITQDWMKNIGYVPQNVLLIDDTIKNNITLGENPNLTDENQLNESLDKAGLRKFIDSLSDGLNTVVGERGTRLSGGQRQRIGIARAVYRDPYIIIFDESTSALDDLTEREILKSINEFFGEKTIIIISHRMTVLENCQKIYEITNKKLLKVC